MMKEKFYLNKKGAYWLSQLSGWGLWGVFMIFVLYADKRLNFNTLCDVFFSVLALMLISHLYRFFIVRKGWLKLLFSKLIWRVILASLVCSSAYIPFALLFSLIFNAEQINQQLSTEFLVQSLLEGGFLYFCWSMVYFLYHYISNYNRNLRWEALINEFELNRLKSQLNPHFIFNALNSVKALVDENPKKAKASINQLSNILRNSLLMDKKKVIGFDEELNIVKDYLALESTRYEDRLRVGYQIDNQANAFKVPPMLLQTLVENGIKHGVSKFKNGGEILIEAQVQQEILVIKIRNTGSYQPNKIESGNQNSSGYGLKSTIQRLKLLYENKAIFKIGNENENLVLTELHIPKWNESTTVVSV